MVTVPGNLAAEEKLVLACIRMDAEGEGEMRTLLAGHLNWEAVYEAGLRHAVLPLLYRGILAANQDLLPEGAGKIRDTYLANAHRNLRLAKTALQVSELFQQQGIHSLLIKGPATAVLAYGDLSLRSFVDLDFLIHPQDFILSHQALVDHGWQPSLSLNEKEKKWLLWGDKDLSYHRQSMNLELHWNIAEKGVAYPIQGCDLWGSVQSFQLLDRELHTLSPENFLLFLALHGTKHRWRPLKFIADFAAYVRSCPDLDWAGIQQSCARFGLHRCTSLGFHLAQQYCGTGLSGELQQIFRSDARIFRLAESVAHNFIPSADQAAAGTLFYLQARERIRDRAYYVLDQALVPKQADWMAISVPEIFYPLYYFLRPLRLIYKLGIMPVKDLIQSKLKTILALF
jgi:hypothetical protein